MHTSTARLYSRQLERWPTSGALQWEAGSIRCHSSAGGHGVHTVHGPGRLDTRYTCQNCRYEGLKEFPPSQENTKSFLSDRVSSSKQKQVITQLKEQTGLMSKTVGCSQGPKATLYLSGSCTARWGILAPDTKPTWQRYPFLCCSTHCGTP